MEWLIVLLIILGFLLIILPILAYTFDGKSEWWIWLLVALGVVFLLAALIIWLIYTVSSDIYTTAKDSYRLERDVGSDAEGVAAGSFSDLEGSLGVSDKMGEKYGKDAADVGLKAAPLLLLA